MKQETLEEAKYNAYKEYWNENHTQEVKSNFLTAFKLGAKWQQERGYSDMQEYATFCIECDRKEMPLLLVRDWYEHYKK